MALPSSHDLEPDSDPLAEARRAARRAGMSLGQWLDMMVSESEARKRKASAEAFEEQTYEALGPIQRRLDEVEERLRTSQAPGEAAAPRGAGGDAAPLDAPEALRAIARRLDRLGGNIAADGETAEAARATVGQLEQHLQAMARSMPAARADEAPNGNGRGKDPAAIRRPIDGLKRAIDEISSRQKALDREVEASPKAEARQRPQDLETKIRALSGRLDRQHGFASEMRSEFERFGTRLDEASRDTRSGLDGIRTEVRDAVRDLDQARRGETERLQAELSDLSKRIEGLQLTSPDVQVWVEDFAARLESATKDELAAMRAEIREANSLVETLVKSELETLRHEFKALSDRVGPAGGGSPDLDARLEDLALRLDTATRSEIATLRQEIQEVGKAVERVSRTDLGALQGEFSKLSGRIDEIGKGAPDLDARIEDIALRLDTATRREIGELRQEIKALAGQVDGGAMGELSSLKEEISKIADVLNLERTAAGDDNDGRTAALAGLNAIRDEIRGLSDRIDGNQDGYSSLRDEVRSLNERLATQKPERLDEMERRLNELADRLEANSGAIDMGALAQLEGEVVRLSQLLGETSGKPADLSGVENAINDLFDRIEEDRAIAVAAARDAAEEAVRRALESMETREAAGPVSEALREELVALRRHADESDERTRGTLTAVHDTLQKIVERLTRLEAEVEDGMFGLAAAPMEADVEPEVATVQRRTEAEAVAVAEPEPEPELEPEAVQAAPMPDEVVGRIKAVTRSFRNEIDDNTPLAPGSGRPSATPDVADPEEGDAVPPVRGKEKPARGSDFIAAARRAAQSSTVETRGARLVPDGDEEESGGFSPLAMVKRYRKPLAIAGAIVIVTVGGMQIVKFMQSGEIDLGSLLSQEIMVASLPPAKETAPVPEKLPAAERAPAPAVVARPTAPAETTAAASPVDPIETGSIPSTTDAQSVETIEAAEPAEERVEMAALPTATERTTATGAAAHEMPAEAVGPESLRRAAANGDAAAQYEVAVRLAEGQGFDRDLEGAAEWYRRAAAQGLAPAQYRLGSLYEKGEGVERDLNLARTWYQRAAEQGNRKAMHNLAVLFADGIEGSPDYERAAIWFRQAAEYGLSDSQYNLAILYARGMGLPQNLAESYKWFGIASAQGDTEATSRQEDVAARLDAQTIAALDQAVSSFEPKALVESANSVAGPAGGWARSEEKAEDTGADRSAMGGGHELVRIAQSKLTQLGYDVGLVDGKIGPKTREAVRSFQRANAMSETGDIDPQLVQRLNEATS